MNWVLYPVSIHRYVGLVYNNHLEEAKQLMEKFLRNLEEYYQDELRQFIQCKTKEEQMARNELIDTFKSNQFIIRMSKHTFPVLKLHLQEEKHSVLLNFVHEHLTLTCMKILLATNNN